ncbi:MAG: Flagellar biosynthesis protein FliO [Chloroflexota bacterium]|jgi:flagellar protein FliO/FliZ|nr:Flagellar biosynthesis protein FliO [Chloroflexota bacterium]
MPLSIDRLRDQLGPALASRYARPVLIAAAVVILAVGWGVARPSEQTVGSVLPTASAVAQPGSPAPRLGGPSESFDMTGAAMDISVKLVIVLALAYGSLALLKRYTMGDTHRTGHGTLQVLESVTLAPNRSVYVIRVGDERLVVGVTPTQLTTLSTLRDPAPIADDAATRNP